MARFRNIRYPILLYDTLRNYWSVNSAGKVSILFKYILCIIQPLQQPFDIYDRARQISLIIARCKWQIGQLTNVLNYLYDSTLSRIFITQSVISVDSDVTFPYPFTSSDSVFGEAILISERVFGDKSDQTATVINIPAGVNLAAITATVEQIKVKGIPYIIEYIP